MRVLICEDETIIRLDLRATFEDATTRSGVSLATRARSGWVQPTSR